MKKYILSSSVLMASVVSPLLAFANEPSASEVSKALAGMHDQIVFVQFLTLVSIVLAIGGMTAGVGAMLGYWSLRRK